MRLTYFQFSYGFTRLLTSMTAHGAHTHSPGIATATHDTYPHRQSHRRHRHSLASPRAPTAHTRHRDIPITSRVAPRRRGAAPPPVVSCASAGGFVGRTTTSHPTPHCRPAARVAAAAVALPTTAAPVSCRAAPADRSRRPASLRRMRTPRGGSYHGLVRVRVRVRAGFG